jgi:hypothetical protein
MVTKRATNHGEMWPFPCSQHHACCFRFGNTQKEAICATEKWSMRVVLRVGFTPMCVACWSCVLANTQQYSCSQHHACWFACWFVASSTMCVGLPIRQHTLLPDMAACVRVGGPPYGGSPQQHTHMLCGKTHSLDSLSKERKCSGPIVETASSVTAAVSAPTRRRLNSPGVRRPRCVLPAWPATAAVATGMDTATRRAERDARQSTDRSTRHGRSMVDRNSFRIPTSRRGCRDLSGRLTKGGATGVARRDR